MLNTKKLAYILAGIGIVIIFVLVISRTSRTKEYRPAEMEITSVARRAEVSVLPS